MKTFWDAGVEVIRKEEVIRKIWETQFEIELEM